jgi:hypothetical protein
VLNAEVRQALLSIARWSHPPESWPFCFAKVTAAQRSLSIPRCSAASDLFLTPTHSLLTTSLAHRIRAHREEGVTERRESAPLRHLGDSAFDDVRSDENKDDGPVISSCRSASSDHVARVSTGKAFTDCLSPLTSALASG